jgi:hypothetical protein
MTEDIRLEVDGHMIKKVRRTGLHSEALRIIRPGHPNSAVGELLYIGRTAPIPLAQGRRIRVELQGDFTPGSPEPDFHEAWPLKHVYINQGRRRTYLNALVARCNGASWYAHDIRIIGNSEIVYDRRGGGFRDNVQLWIRHEGGCQPRGHLSSTFRIFGAGAPLLNSPEDVL